MEPPSATHPSGPNRPSRSLPAGRLCPRDHRSPPGHGKPRSVSENEPNIHGREHTPRLRRNARSPVAVVHVAAVRRHEVRPRLGMMVAQQHVDRERLTVELVPQQVEGLILDLAVVLLIGSEMAHQAAVETHDLPVGSLHDVQALLPVLADLRFAASGKVGPKSEQSRLLHLHRARQRVRAGLAGSSGVSPSIVSRCAPFESLSSGVRGSVGVGTRPRHACGAPRLPIRPRCPQLRGCPLPPARRTPASSGRDFARRALICVFCGAWPCGLSLLQGTRSS
jgi:hypothetical protein